MFSKFTSCFKNNKKLTILFFLLLIIFLVGVSVFFFNQSEFSTGGKLAKAETKFSNLDIKKITPTDIMGEGEKVKILSYLKEAQLDLQKGNKTNAKDQLILAEQGLCTWKPKNVPVHMPQDDQEASQFFYSNWAKRHGVIEPWWETYKTVVKLINGLSE